MVAHMEEIIKAPILPPRNGNNITARREAVFKAQSKKIYKQNTLIRQGRAKLTIHEQRTIAYLCSLIPYPSDGNIKNIPRDYIFNIDDYCTICNLSKDGGMYLRETKKVLKKLHDKSMYIKNADGNEVLVSWVEKVWILNKNLDPSTNGKGKNVKVRLDEDLLPYLIGLQETLTEYGFWCALRFTSTYSAILLELLESYIDEEKQTTIFEISVEELKHHLMVEDVKSYSDFGVFRSRCLELALKEINEYTNLQVKMEYIKESRKIVKVRFVISYKQLALIQTKQEELLNITMEKDLC